ncbi:MAG TPA: phosphodiester glycosidase family protein [Rhodanobacteraceae bacterium]
MPPHHHHRRHRARLILLLATGILLVACSERGPAPHGLRSREIHFGQASFRVVDMNLTKTPLALYWRNPVTHQPFDSIANLQQWGSRQGRTLLFAANAGIYDSQRKPLGLYVADGKTLVRLNTAHGNPRHGNFSLLPNGVFFIDTHGQAHVLTTPEFRKQHIHPRLATQSGPMLVIDGKLNAQFETDSHSVKWRSGVCAKSSTQVVFAISETPVNFHTFARLFRDKLGCRNALYLDGTLSQFFVDGTYYGSPDFMVRPYAGMFAVFVPSRSKAEP